METPFHTLNLRFAGVNNEPDDEKQDLLTCDTNITASAFTHSLKSYQDAKEDVLLRKISSFELKEQTNEVNNKTSNSALPCENSSAANDATLQTVKDFV